jgi:EmrB/QacA subfamily drug resistance transporter
VPDGSRHHWWVLSVTGLGVLLTGLNTSTLAVALPVLSRHFHATATQASWLLLSYMLVTTVLILSFGRVADIVGRRQMYIAGLGLFTLASLLAGFSPNASVLVGIRAVQAIGAASIITNTTAILTDAFPARQLTLALGLNVTMISGAQVLGPLVGGFVATTAGWRAVFWFNVPVGVAGLIWAGLVLRRNYGSGGRRRGESFDVVGAVLSFVVIGALVLTLSEGGAIGWASWPVFAGAACFVVFTPLFVWTQLHRIHPLVDLSLLSDRERAMAYLANLLLSVARFAIVILASLYVQAARGTDSFHAGLQVLPVAFGMMVASPVAGRLAVRVPARVLSTVGLSVVAAGLAALAVVISPEIGYPALTTILFVIGAGCGFFQSPNTSSIMASVPADRRGIANGMRSTLQNAGYVSSTALTLAIVTGPLRPAEKSAAYAGELSQLPGADLDAFTGGYRIALVLLAVLTAAGAAVSLMRSGRKEGRAAVD